jgi:oligopeptide/dipeptide ABC transporter ATP-binding protein
MKDGAKASKESGMEESLLKVVDLEVSYRVGANQTLTAVDRVSLEIRRQEALGLVGESGCGKSSLARAVLQLVRPAAGAVWFSGQDLTKLAGPALRSMRRHMQIIFQDPRGSLNPRWRVRRIVEEPLRVHHVASGSERRRLARAMLEEVGLDRSFDAQRPAQLSGGQQQRVGIARALVTHPKLVVCDEPVSSLDVSIRAQVINLLQDLKERMGLAYLFVAHDLGVVRYLCDRVAVMYLGQIVETAPAVALFARPLHPYTKGLLVSVLRSDLEARAQLKTAERLAAGDVPSILNPPQGCRYHPRCPHAQPRCRVETPMLEAANGAEKNQRAVACHFWREIEQNSRSAPVA